MFMGQYFKGNNMAQIKIHNGGCYAHAHKLLMVIITSV